MCVYACVWEYASVYTQTPRVKPYTEWIHEKVTKMCFYRWMCSLVMVTDTRPHCKYINIYLAASLGVNLTNARKRKCHLRRCIATRWLTTFNCPRWQLTVTGAAEERRSSEQEREGVCERWLQVTTHLIADTCSSPVLRERVELKHQKLTNWMQWNNRWSAE